MAVISAATPKLAKKKAGISISRMSRRRPMIVQRCQDCIKRRDVREAAIIAGVGDPSITTALQYCKYSRAC
jgi:hypothetical protein